MKSIVNLGAVALLLVLSTSLQALTLDEAVRHTLETHPDVMAARYEVQSRTEEVKQAKAGYLPKFDLAAGVGREDTRTPSTGNDEVSLTRHESSLQLRQMVFDGFATKEEVNRQKARKGSAFYSSKATEESIALRTTEVYLNLLRQHELLDLARETLHEHQNIHDQMVLRARSGVGSKADLDQISARLALSQSNMIAAQNNLLDAKTNFYRVTGVLPEMKALEMPTGNGSFPANLEQGVELALKNHPTLLSASADIDAARAQYQASKSTFWPRLQIEADRRWDEDIDGVEGDNEDFVVALRLRYNLYNGNADSARRKQTAYLVEEAKSIRNNTQRQVIESLRLSWSAYAAVQEQLKYLLLNVDAAVNTRSAYLKQFNIGRRTLLDLLNTENEVIDAKRSLVNAQFDKLFSQYRIYNSMGQLLSSLHLEKDTAQSEEAESSTSVVEEALVEAAEVTREPAVEEPESSSSANVIPEVEKEEVTGSDTAAGQKVVTADQEVAVVPAKAEMTSANAKPVELTTKSYDLVYTVQIAAFKESKGRDRFVAQRTGTSFYCRRKDNGLHAIYYGLYPSDEAAKDGLIKVRRVAKSDGYIVKLKNVSFFSCKQ